MPKTYSCFILIPTSTRRVFAGTPSPAQDLPVVNHGGFLTCC